MRGSIITTLSLFVAGMMVAYGIAYFFGREFILLIVDILGLINLVLIIVDIVDTIKCRKKAKKRKKKKAAPLV